MLSLQSDTESLVRETAEGRELSQQAVQSARRSDEKEPAALWQTNAAIREALFGNADAARQNASTAVALASVSRDAEAQAALAFALSGDAGHAQSLVDDLANRLPQDTVVQSVWMPTIRAQIEIGRKNPARSIDLLQAPAPYELGAISYPMCPVYVRGEAYLAAFGQRSRHRVPENPRPSRHRGQRAHRRTRASPNRQSLRHAGRHRQSQDGLSGFSSRYGKMPTPTFPFSSLRRRNTRS